MSLTTFNEDMNIISALADEPTQSASELKAKFDEGGGKIKNYLNTVLTDELDVLLATIPDLCDSLSSSDSDKALSARQGKVLSELISGLSASLGTKQKSITSGTAEPSGGEEGDIYLRYAL